MVHHMFIYQENNILLNLMFDLNDEETIIMEKLGELEISQNRNIRLETIKKKLKPKYHANLRKNIDRLIIKHRLIDQYRPKNYCLTDEGLKVAHFLWDKRKEKSYDYRIVKRG